MVFSKTITKKAAMRRVVALAIGFALPTTVHADLSCSRESQSMVRPKIDAFILRPETTLELYPRGDSNGDNQMQIAIRELVASDMTDTLDLVLKLLPKANGFQKQAIGAGLGSAARQCDRATRPADRYRLVRAAKDANDATMLRAFMATYIAAPIPADLGSSSFEPNKNPLGRPNIASPGTNLFGDQKIRDPSAVSDSFAPIK